VDAEFLATATLPLVIDPQVSQFWLDSTTTDTKAPDMAWDPFNGVWLAVYESVFSATDTDVFARMLGATGTTIATGWIDFTSNSWRRPRCANNNAGHQFLVVAEVTNLVPHAVQGRLAQPNGTILTLGAQFDIGGSAAGDKLTPDVGGDPFPTTPSFFCVTFQHTLSSSDSEVGYRLVTSAGAPVGAGPTYFPDGLFEPDLQPSVSRSDDGAHWLISWVHSSFTTFGDIKAAVVNWDGTLLSGPFGISAGPTFDFTPCSSSPLAGTQRFAVAFSRRTVINGQVDVIVAALNGSTVLQLVNLMALEGSATQAQDQLEPGVDSDGQHFLVTYSEFDTVFSNYNLFADDLYLADNQLGLSQGHVQLHAGLGLYQRISRVAAARALNVQGHRYGVIYEVRQNDTDHDVSAVLFDAFQGGVTSAFCLGDGSGTACPCGNNGAAGHGCANSVNASGATLTAAGTASTVADTLQLSAGGMPATATCLFFQGTTAAAAAPFGDGLRCVGGTVIRLATKTAAGGAASYPEPGDPSISVRGALTTDGGQRAYQVWYRNSAAFCTSATFNLTGGVRVDWAR
jgi:hypothetical protein